MQVVRVLLYYARALDNTMLVALNTIPLAQAKGTQATLKACMRLLNYAATHPDATIRFQASAVHRFPLHSLNTAWYSTNVSRD
jgi:hypothetical protein